MIFTIQPLLLSPHFEGGGITPHKQMRKLSSKRLNDSSPKATASSDSSTMEPVFRPQHLGSFFFIFLIIFPEREDMAQVRAVRPTPGPRQSKLSREPLWLSDPMHALQHCSFSGFHRRGCKG